MSDEPERVFKGVWIPVEVWDAKEISWMEKCLVAEIDALDDGTGCFASNEYLARKFGTSVSSIANQISDLRAKNYIIDLGFDGRTRRISLHPQVKAGFTHGLTQRSPGGEARNHPGVNSPIRENKQEVLPEIAPKARKGKKFNGLPTTPEAIWVASLFNRNPKTKWMEREVAAFLQHQDALSDPDVRSLVAAYYKSERAKAEPICRKDLQTFVNNILGEIDRARAWAQKNPKMSRAIVNGIEKPVKLAADIASTHEFAEWLSLTYQKTPAEVPERLRAELVKEFKRDHTSSI